MHQDLKITQFYNRFKSQDEDSFLGALRTLCRLADVQHLAVDGDPTSASVWTNWVAVEEDAAIAPA